MGCENCKVCRNSEETCEMIYPQKSDLNPKTKILIPDETEQDNESLSSNFLSETKLYLIILTKFDFVLKILKKRLKIMDFLIL